MRRVVPVVRALAADAGVPVSVDTTKAVVARAALEAGAAMVNDISAGTFDDEMLSTVAAADAAYVLMHMRGSPRTMKDLAQYDDVVSEVGTALRIGAECATNAGINPGAILVDPGLGFAKTAEHNLALLRALPQLGTTAGMPLLVGASRKSFLGRVLGDAGAQRDDATLATTVWSMLHGATVVRVHDVERSRRAIAMLDVMERATESGVAA
jgi:dihydropteroate synthase